MDVCTEQNVHTVCQWKVGQTRWSLLRKAETLFFLFVWYWWMFHYKIYFEILLTSHQNCSLLSDFNFFPINFIEINDDGVQSVDPFVSVLLLLSLLFFLFIRSFFRNILSFFGSIHIWPWFGGGKLLLLFHALFFFSSLQHWHNFIELVRNDGIM